MNGTSSNLQCDRLLHNCQEAAFKESTYKKWHHAVSLACNWCPVGLRWKFWGEELWDKFHLWSEAILVLVFEQLDGAVSTTRQKPIYSWLNICYCRLLQPSELTMHSVNEQATSKESAPVRNTLSCAPSSPMILNTWWFEKLTLRKQSFSAWWLELILKSY